MSEKQFDGKVAIGSGGPGLGEARAKELAARGAKVIIADLNLTGAVLRARSRPAYDFIFECASASLRA